MNRKCVLAVVCALALLLTGQTCVTTVDPGHDGGNGGGTANQVTVRMVNGSAVAVAVQLFTSTGTVVNPETELFVPTNQQLASIGFAGSGILQPGQVDDVQFDCAAAVSLGTPGGAFLNVDTGVQVGTGTRYVLIQGSQFQCGSTITFTYLPSGNGFRTDVSVVGLGG